MQWIVLLFVIGLLGQVPGLLPLLAIIFVIWFISAVIAGVKKGSAKPTVNSLETQTIAPNKLELTNQEEAISISHVDQMEGREFEFFCSDLLKANGFYQVEVTPGSGDQGVDILAKKDEVKYAIQCKCYSSPLGNSPIQEVHAGKSFYGCHVAVVITNSTFTQGARTLAERTGVLLWDRTKLVEMIRCNPSIDSVGYQSIKVSDTTVPILNNVEVDIYVLVRKHTFLNGQVNKIALIKEVRALTGAGLRESKDFVEHYC